MQEENYGRMNLASQTDENSVDGMKPLRRSWRKNQRRKSIC